ncbi:unnamed protein product [Rhizophagus irregularis]|nr:unnamed protein product [Rhizophagus irregularis]
MINSLNIRFGNKTVFLAYFKDKVQLDDAIALDGDTDQAWVIHGKRQDSSTAGSPREGLASALISTVPKGDNRGKSVIQKIQNSAIVTPATFKEPTTEEVVDTVNKFRKNLLNEVQVEMVSIPLKDYTSPGNVVRIIEEYREEIMVEHEKISLSDTIMIDSSTTNDAAEKLRVNDVKNKAKSKLAEKEVKDAKNKLVSTGNSVKTVTPVELHEYTNVNANCTERLQKKSEYLFTLTNRNPFVVSPDDGSSQPTSSSSSDDEEYIKEVKKHIKKKQGTRSDVEFEESEDGLREVKKEKTPWAGKPGSRMGRKKKKGKNKK